MIIVEINRECKNDLSPNSTQNSIEQAENQNGQLVIISKQITKNKKLVVNDKKKKIKLKKVNWLDIQLPLQYNNIFQLPGHILLEICPEKSECVQLQLKEVQISEQYFTLYKNSLERYSQFEEVINLLERSQSQQNYDVSQQLKMYQKIYENQNELINVIKQQADFEDIQKLQQERQKFKDNYIAQYVKQHMNEDDFFVISSIGVNLNKQVSDLNYVHFSKAYFALIGLDEQSFRNMNIQKILLFLIIPPQTRRIMFKQLLNTYVSDKALYKKQISLFEFHTLDKIKIECNTEFQYIETPYPGHLRNEYLDSFHISMDNILITVPIVQDHHLKKILEQRAQFPIQYLEDLEYTMFSEIFLEKFYPEQLHKLQQKQIQEEMQEKGIEDEKRCSYKYINWHN